MGSRHTGDEKPRAVEEPHCASPDVMKMSKLLCNPPSSVTCAWSRTPRSVPLALWPPRPRGLGLANAADVPAAAARLARR